MWHACRERLTPSSISEKATKLAQKFGPTSDFYRCVPSFPPKFWANLHRLGQSNIFLGIRLFVVRLEGARRAEPPLSAFSLGSVGAAAAAGRGRRQRQPGAAAGP